LILLSGNDSIVEKLRRRGIFRKPVVAAIDLFDDHYYGEYNKRLRRSKKGKRITIFTIPVY
jgi:hypothetical protein